MAIIQEFKSLLAGGGARPNQFRVLLSFPAYVTAAATARRRSILVNAAALPSADINPTITYYRGREVKFAGERTFAPWTISVMNDSDFSIRTAMEQWIQGMNENEFNVGILQPELYQTNIEVEQLDRNDAVLKRYTLYSAFPTNISEVPLSYAQNDVISEFQVTFQYQHWRTN
jgi:hypothetical protein